MMWTNDPISDAGRYAAEQEREMEKLPRCEYCDEPIDGDFYYEINDEVICQNCLNSHFRKDVDDYVS